MIGAVRQPERTMMLLLMCYDQPIFVVCFVGYFKFHSSLSVYADLELSLFRLSPSCTLFFMLPMVPLPSLPLSLDTCTVLERLLPFGALG